MAVDLKNVDKIVRKYEKVKGAVIPILQEIQKNFGYIPKEALERMAEVSNYSPSQIFGVATFYSQFRLKPVGRNIIKVCFGTACHVSGAEMIAEALCDELKIEIGGTTKDKKFTLETVACLGCCSLAPVIMINQTAYGNLTPDEARKVVKEFKERFFFKNAG